MSSSLFMAPHPLVPLATFNVVDGHTAALEECCGADPVQQELALLNSEDVEPRSESPKYSLFPSEDQCTNDAQGHGAPDFLGRLHHLKTLFRMSATSEPVSVMIHRVGPLLILDDGPCGWSHGDSDHSQQPLPPLSDGGCRSQQRPLEKDSQLMLAALEPSLAEAIARGPPGLKLPDSVPSGHRLCVRNTFVDVESDAEEEVGTWSAPARLGAASPATPQSSGAETPQASIKWDLPLSPVMQQLHEHAARAAEQWSLIPYQPETTVPSGESEDSAAGPPHMDLLQLATANRKAVKSTSRVLEAVRSLYTGIPPQPSRFGRAVQWRCGPFKILLGCDLVVLRSDDQCELSDFASFKMLPPGAPTEPSREERIDAYLENSMCDITKAVWGSQKQGHTTWRVFDTADLPAASAPAEEPFDGQQLQEQGQRLLHFLRQQCHREGGTYWLFREQNSSAAELFDLSASTNLTAEDNDSWKSSSRAFRTTPSLALPIASLCFRLAKAMPDNADQRQLLQKGLHLLEPVKEDHVGMYCMLALQLACSYMRTPMPAIHDAKPQASAQSGGQPTEPPAAGRLTLALRYLESMLKLLTSLDDSDRDEVALAAELCLQGHVAYSECILKLVREVCIPTYSTWLAEVQKTSQDLRQQSTNGNGPGPLQRMKQLSAALLLWRLFWLCRAQRAFAFLPLEKRETECWTLDRDLCETSGDALFGLSRYPAEDIDGLLSGQMSTAEGVCKLVEDSLRNWGLSAAGGSTGSGHGQAEGKAGKERKGSVSRSKTNGRQLPSPVASPRSAGPKEETQPHRLQAILLSNLNPLARGIGDESLREDPLVRDDRRRALWTEGEALSQSLLFYKRATARLRKSQPCDNTDGPSGTAQPPRSEDQATIKVARKLAHLYNEEARVLLLRQGSSDTDTVEVEALLTQAKHWMTLCADHANAARVLLNLSELYARRAEQHFSDVSEPFTEAQYELWLKAVGCCEEAATQSETGLGRREGAFAHLRVGVHFSVRVPFQPQLADSGRPESLAELANRHLSKALRLFDELHDEREIAVCHFHMADLLLQEQRIAGAAPTPKSRLIAALRHARRSSEYWERLGILEYAKDFIASNVRIARLLECQQRTGSTFEALGHLSEVESSLVALAARGRPCDREQEVDGEQLFVRDKSSGKVLAVAAFRREMARICQSGLRQGEQVDRLKAMYRSVLRNESLRV